MFSLFFTLLVSVVFTAGCSSCKYCTHCDLGKDKGVETKVIAQEKDYLVNITSERHFEDIVLKSKIPVIVDFSTQWCRYCKLMHPIVETLAKACKNKCLFTIVDGDALRAIVSRYNIQGFPTFIFFKNSKEIDRVSGALSLEEFSKKIKDFLNK
jgi:thioredoxin